MNYQRIYNQIIERSKDRILIGYGENHHIIPKCMGGTNNKDNMVKLTAKEHFLCHKLLCEIYPDNKKLKYAYWRMCNAGNKYQERHYRISSREFELLKTEFVKNISKEPKSKWRHSEKSINKIRLARSKQTFSEETRKKFSENTKKRHLDGTIKSSNKPVKCILEGIEFNSMSEAGRYFGVSSVTIKRKIESGEHVKPEIKEKEIIKLKIEGIEFDTIKNAADYFKIEEATLGYRLRKGLDPIKDNLKKKKIKINEMEFDSVTSAIKELGIPKTTLMRKLKDENEINFIYLN